MELDWDFFFDDWLIDKIPDGFEIRVESRPDGEFINPPELDIYFGANPKYLYGTGKMLHEVIMSPSGIAIFPSFLNRPGFEFVEEISFSVGFNESVDFHGRNVEQQHVGLVEVADYMKNIQKRLYGLDDGDYSSTNTPSMDLRLVTQEELDTSIENLAKKYVYPDGFPPDVDVITCCSMSPNPTSGTLEDIHSGSMSYTVRAPGATIVSPGVYRNVVFLKFSYLELMYNITPALKYALRDDFSIFFTTTSNFREGILFEFDFSAETGNSHGFRVQVLSELISVSIGDGTELRIFNFFNDTDFTVPHSMCIYRKNDYLVVVIDGESINRIDITGFYPSFPSSNSKFLVGGTVTNSKTISTNIGDIENLTILKNTKDEVFDKMAILGTRIVPDNQNDFAKDTPPQLSYGLTYNNPTRMFIPNYFGTAFNKFYISNDLGNVQIIGGKVTNEAYVHGGTPAPNHHIVMPNDYAVFSATTFTFEDGVDDGIIGTKIKALTKVTSDVHIPLKMHLKFRLPEFYDRGNTYNMSLIMRSLEKFLWYNYKKYKTGEFI